MTTFINDMNRKALSKKPEGFTITFYCPIKTV